MRGSGLHPKKPHWEVNECPIPGFVYFIQAGGSDGAIKIGWADDVEKRRSDLQTANPEELRIIGVKAGVRDMEKALHRKLAPHRIRGEWFRAAPEVLAEITSNATGVRFIVVRELAKMASVNRKTALRWLRACRSAEEMFPNDMPFEDAREAVVAWLGLHVAVVENLIVRPRYPDLGYCDCSMTSADSARAMERFRDKWDPDGRARYP